MDELHKAGVEREQTEKLKNVVLKGISEEFRHSQ